MWRTGREPYQRYNPRPYPSARPKIVLSPIRRADRNQKNGVPKPGLFLRDSPAKPTSSPLKPNLFGAFHFQPQTTRPVLSSDRANGASSPAQNAQFVPSLPKTTHASPDAMPPQTSPRKSTPPVPGAFPTTEPADYVLHDNANRGVHRGKDQAREARRRRRKPASEPDAEIRRLKRFVRSEFGKGPLGDEEKQLLAQMNSLHMDCLVKNGLFQGCEVMERASHLTEDRARKLKERDVAVEKLVQAEAEAEEREKIRLAEEDEKRRRVEEQLERQRQEIRRRDRKRAEEWQRLEAQRLDRERVKRFVEELAEQGKQRERERQRKEAQAKQEEEVRAKQYAEERRRLQEAIRMARTQFPAGDAQSIQRQFEEYEAKWTELKDGRPLPPLTFGILPWPVVGPPISDPSELTLQRIQEFIFHPLRNGNDSKSRRDRVRAEILRWHPDKFNSKVLGKVIHPDEVSQAAGYVARFLTQIMEAETTN